MAQLTEEGLVERKREFAAEIESLEVALESVVSEGPGHVDVVSEISEAVEKSRRVLQDLDHAVRSFREATAEGRPFTQEEIDLFRYFGFEPQPHASPSPSASSSSDSDARSCRLVRSWSNSWCRSIVFCRSNA
eukprot:Rhum_TRINITY_DN12743_c0_g1::Rhum_TRINITY_DN12743_c0_g1_i2::g.53771::m.53771